MADETVHPFVLDVPDEELEDLRDRLVKTRFPNQEVVDDWSQGLPLDYALELREFWVEDYEWRETEAELNDLGQFVTEIDGIDIHFLHVRSSAPNATPLLLTHGWPGSVIEFLDVIGPLTDPAAHGGDAADAFDVIAPSLPGYGFSGKPAEAGWGGDRIAAAWATLMDRLGTGPFIAQGGDWGSLITTILGSKHADRVAGIHVNMPIAIPSSEDMTDAEKAAMDHYNKHQKWGTGYSTQQATRPQTLGYGLADSPMGQAAWIIEKFHAWTDNDGHPESAVSRDRLLDNVMLYWLSNSGASSARLYWESFRSPNLDPVPVPTGISSFPKEIFPCSRRWAETRFSDLRHWSEHEQGGHFAAMEQPDALVDDIRAFARTL